MVRINLQFFLFYHESRVKPQLAGGFNTIEKYARQIGSFPQVGVFFFETYITASPSKLRTKVLIFLKDQFTEGLFIRNPLLR